MMIPYYDNPHYLRICLGTSLSVSLDLRLTKDSLTRSFITILYMDWRIGQILYVNNCINSNQFQLFGVISILEFSEMAMRNSTIARN